MKKIKYQDSTAYTLVAKEGKEAWIKNKYGTSFFVPVEDIQEITIMKVKDVPPGKQFAYSGREFTKLAANGLMNNHIQDNTVSLCVGTYSISHFSSNPDTEVEVLN